MTDSDFAEAVRQYGLQGLEEIEPDSVEGAELHNRLFNEDYFVIGTYRAKQLLESYGIFEAIERVREYEQDNFGEVTTEIDPEKIANMLAYIIGEEWLGDSDTLTKAWDRTLTSSDLVAIREEVQA